MRFSRRSLLFWAAAGLLLLGCKKKPDASAGLRGSGIQTTKDREIPAFSRLELNAKIHAYVKVGAHRPMKVKGDDNLVDHVRTRLENGVMRIDTDTKVKGQMPLEVHLGVAELESVVGSGSSRIYIEGLKAKSFEARAGVATRIVAEGIADSLSLTGEGAGELDFSKVPSRAATIALVKAATARVGYLEELDVRLSGMTRVYYSGEPAIKQDVQRPAALIKTK